jgi:hypothetical protein
MSQILKFTLFASFTLLHTLRIFKRCWHFCVGNLILYRHDKLSGMKDASASPQRSLRDRSGKRHGRELEEQLDIPSDSSSPNRRQRQSAHEIVGHSGQTKKASLKPYNLRLTNQKVSVFMCRKNSHMYQRIKNLLIKDIIIWSLHMYFVEMKIITFHSSYMFGLLIC